MTVEHLLTDEIVEELSRAAQRGVSIKLGGVSPEVQTRLEDDISGAELFESLWVWSDTTAGRLMMVDQRRTLVSALGHGPEQAVSDLRPETAIWGTGESNSLVSCSGRSSLGGSTAPMSCDRDRSLTVVPLADTAKGAWCMSRSRVPRHPGR